MKNLKNEIKEIWDGVYKENSREELGWYEVIPEPSLSLIKKYTLNKNEKILDAGCGESTLLQFLVDNEFKDIEGIDLSSEAIDFQKKSLKYSELDVEIKLKVADLTENLEFNKKGKIWHDRAVFHFLFDSSLRRNYKNNVKKFLVNEGVLILSCFSKKNEAIKCNGLLVNKQDIKELEEFFKDSFVLIESLEYDYIMPWGDIRKYIYCIFKKKSYNLG
ncbi:class I SAM-dependent methyltransferase [Cetobacterium sp.]|uniref:class I SAM-dependent methyltransferase n=1 Tax=Cetobacterium sp. TaxID=2071632 RepID=UPI00261AB130|nr:class I SAM-dependent methyltransferase [uncultured Cetobacterium sp.]